MKDLNSGGPMKIYNSTIQLSNANTLTNFHIHIMHPDIIKVFFIHQLMHKCIVLKKILKFTLKLTLNQLQHVSVQSHHHQGAQYSCLLKLQLLK